MILWHEEAPLHSGSLVGTTSMSGKKVSPGLARPDCDQPVGPITFRICDCHLGSGCLAVPPHTIDNCLVARDGWKCD